MTLTGINEWAFFYVQPAVFYDAGNYYFKEYYENGEVGDIHDYAPSMLRRCDSIHVNHSHVWDEFETEYDAHCGNEGSRLVFCSECGAAKRETIPVNGIHVWDAGAITQEPTTTSEGVKTFTCTVCGETRTESIPKLVNTFKDFATSRFFFDAVLWAVSQDPQITSGYSDNTFRPDQVCTRAHVVTFLWRAKGCPEPESLVSPFKDVTNTSIYYYKAVLWAAEQGITTGYSDGTFRPNDECIRSQIVTFLWRANGSPDPENANNPFTDVSNGKFYTKAVLWAVENGITTGYSDGTFRPDDECTRGQVVTFLYRAGGAV
jgi:hypothetical protein